MPNLSPVQMPAIQQLVKLQEKPEPFAPGDAMFWTDPYIAGQLLQIHLNPAIDAASRTPQVIQKSVDWFIRVLGLQAGNCVLDLGCGPGLYATRLAQHGLRVTGVDFSQNSIHYAVQKAREDGLEITYRCQDYLQLEDEACFDAALLIYGDLCPLPPEARKRLFANVHRALKPGGYFVLDVSTPRLRQRAGLKNQWYAAEGGFWRPGPHLVLEQGFAYENDLFLDQYVVIEESGEICVYRNWFQDYSPDTITSELQANGFSAESLWSDLTGTPCNAESEWIGIVSRRA